MEQTFQDSPGRWQYPHGEEGKSQRQLCKGILSRHFAEEIDVEPGEETHDEDVGDKNENVEQQSTILFFE